MKKILVYIISCSVLTGVLPASYADAATPWVKVGSSGLNNAAQLFVDYDQDGQYDQFFIQGVGYSPVPIGRPGLQWGGTNFYDNEAILNRDFQNLTDMHANTIRIWKADNTNNANNEFPNYMTTRTLDIAQQYGLKVIPGLWIGFGGYWQCGENGREFVWDDGFFDLANKRIWPSVKADIMARWTAFVTKFKDHPAILFWSIGNENNFQLGPDKQLVEAFYGLINEMAAAAKNIDPNHPVAYVNGGMEVLVDEDQGNGIQQVNDFFNIISTVAPQVDIWGVNTYPGESFGDMFKTFHDSLTDGTKALWISEFGIDAWYSDVADSNGGYEDQEEQSAWDGQLWDEIVAANELGVIGGTVMEYVDEWWKPYQWLCQVPGWQQWWRPWWEFADNNGSDIYPCGVFNGTHDLFGIPPSDTDCDGTNDWFPGAPDQFFNEEWWGIMSTQKNLTSGEPDVLTPRKVYSTLQDKFLVGLNVGPTIESIVADSGKAGDTVTIKGYNFGDFNGDLQYDPASDMDHDGVVDSKDFQIYYTLYTTKRADPNYQGKLDLNHDGNVTISDLFVLFKSFGRSTGDTYVTFAPFTGPSAKILSWNDTEIVCQVPVGVAAGGVQVHTAGETSNSSLFFVDVSPVVGSVSVTEGAPGAIISVNGSGFGETQGDRYIEFNSGRVSPIVSWSDAKIVFRVPIGADTGDVYLVNGQQQVFITSFTVLGGPHITGVSQNPGTHGMLIEIYGTGFDKYISTGKYDPVVDFDHNQAINYADFSAWFSYYGSKEGDAHYRPEADLDHNGIVNITDFLLFAPSYDSSRGLNFITFGNGAEAKIISWTDTKIVCEVPFFAVSGDIYVHVSDSLSNGFYLNIVD